MRNPKNNNLTKTFNGLIEATKRLGKVEGEMNMANKLKDGSFYCPRCDIVWASPGKCRCEPIDITDMVKGDDLRELKCDAAMPKKPGMLQLKLLLI